jgi:alkylation response protein AidB-like acyl-CoA dehydrogenase
MDFGKTQISFSEEQAMLLDAAQGLCADLSPIDKVRSLLEDDIGYDETAWQQMVEMGWTGLALPESVGGSDFGLGALVPLFESMGKRLLTTPLMSTVLAAECLRRTGDPAAVTSLEQIAAGAKATVAFVEADDWGSQHLTTRIEDGKLQGSKRHVADAADATIFVIPAMREGVKVLAVVRGDQIDTACRTKHDVLDATRRAQSITLDIAEADITVIASNAEKALEETQLIGALLVAAESTGAAVSCLNVTVDYLKTRKQFGKLIGSYQALKHPSVDILCAIESSKSLIYQAATELNADALSRDARIACHMAKSKASETLVFAGDRAVQFHGGMGFTYECDAQLYLRRGLWAQQAFGDPMHHRKRLAQLILDDEQV